MNTVIVIGRAEGGERGERGEKVEGGWKGMKANE